MRKLLLVAALAAAVPSAASATTWIAMCTDGNHVQYNQTPGGSGQLYFKNANVPGGLLIGVLSTISSSANVVCGSVNGVSPGQNPPVSQLCIDKTANAITMKWRNNQNVVVDEGKFCTATIKVL